MLAELFKSRQDDSPMSLKGWCPPALVDLINLALSSALDASLGVHVPPNSHGGASLMARNARVLLGSFAARRGAVSTVKSAGGEPEVELVDRWVPSLA
jgi:hypothetical protein